MTTFWKVVTACLPLIASVLVLLGTIWTVSAELRERAATEAYSAYLEALIVRAASVNIPNYKQVTSQSLAAEKFLLYADDKVIDKVALLYEDGIFSCFQKPVEGMPHLHEILVAMREDIGRSGDFNFDKFNSIFCIVWTKSTD